ncbi:tetratricopeptide repeat protein [Synechococcus sp. RSCCF101]|uniref:tetratricopeptide repeat protein n=1 Tax=Synechococcus sp. RSCCF101 TaxID=2511069 RepID=UPI001781C60B|nr:tetratricopeptide repeat protein [Synechococcus sp. RSCCF101]
MTPLQMGLALLAVLLAAGLGWELSGALRQRRPEPAQDSTGDAERDLLRSRIMAGDLSEAEQYELLDRLLLLGSMPEALMLLEQMADRRSEDPGLRLMLAELRRTQNDPEGAERELRLILHRTPAHLEALQMLTLVQLEQDRAPEAEQRLREVMRQLGAGERMEVGLMLAELLGRQERHQEARAVLRMLAGEQPGDVRPHLARALSVMDQGNTAAALAELETARAVAGSELQPLIDGLAASWSLEAMRDGEPPSSVESLAAEDEATSGQPEESGGDQELRGR